MRELPSESEVTPALGFTIETALWVEHLILSFYFQSTISPFIAGYSVTKF